MSGSILIVSHNNIHLTKQAVASALAAGSDVMVIDNCSTDGTREWLRTKPVATALNVKQKSLSACWNAGLRAFFSSGVDAVLVCNNDIVLRPDTYKMLNWHGGEFVTAISVNKLEQLGVEGDRSIMLLRDGARPHPDFSCFLIRKKVVEAVGWFDEMYYPAYYEDNDYHVRMHRAGVMAVCVDLPFLHRGSATLNNAPQAEQFTIRRMAEANKGRFYSKYGCYPGTPEYEALFKEDAVIASLRAEAPHA